MLSKKFTEKIKTQYNVSSLNISQNPITVEPDIVSPLSLQPIIGVML